MNIIYREDLDKNIFIDYSKTIVINRDDDKFDYHFDDNMMKLNVANFLIDKTGAIVLQSPDGTFYKLSVANGGAISGVAVSTDQTSNPYVT